MPARHLSIFALSASLLSAAEEPLSFNNDIRPILSDKCFACHGFDAKSREADLRLDTAEAAYSKHKSGTPIIPGKPEKSIVWQRINSKKPDDIMPPSDYHLKLTEKEKLTIKRWIKEGATYEKHWTFTRVEKPVIKDHSAHPIDALVSERLKKEELKLSPLADKHTLIRRLSLDLRGLPPTPEEVKAYLADDSPDSWNKLVDQFLADKSFGERFAWPWLDAARYADSNGFQGDLERTMWPWRDWVIDAINRNKPFSDFLREQIAGDLLPNANFEQKLATGFLRNHSINGEGGSIPEENRVNYVFDMAETVGTVWMGLTFNCCRCHDHKYDPLSQADYYSLTAFFNQTPVTGSGGNPQTPPVLDISSDAQKAQEQQLIKEQQQLKLSLKEAQDSQKSAKLALKDLPADDLTRPELTQSLKALGEKIKGLLASTKAHGAKLKKYQKTLPRVMIMADMTDPKKFRKTHILGIGSYEDKQDVVHANVPAILPKLPATKDGKAPNRLDLARWLVSRDNPLTSRVTVNNLWQELFGTGIIKTSEDFGVQSELPVHPKLLDWLAVDFMESGWDYKKLIKTIVTSHTYRQSSKVDSLALEKDPNNRLLARGARYRLPSWMIRDQALAASGLLIPKIGGEPVKPWQPEGIWAEMTFGDGKKKYVPDTGEKTRRRALYTFWRRISAPAMIFDNAKRENCSVNPYLTNSPLHALATLNDRMYAEAARALVIRATSPGQADPIKILARAFELINIRPPHREELGILKTLQEKSQKHFQQNPQAAKELLSIGESPSKSDALDEITHASLTVVCLSLLNTDEALTKE